MVPLVPPHRAENEDRRGKKAQRAAQASDTQVIKENVGLRDPLAHPDLQDLQQRWSDLGMVLLCSRWLDLLDQQDVQGQTGPQDPQELMGSLVIQERTGKLVHRALEVSQELQEVLVPKDRRVSVETDHQDPEAPQVHQDLLGQAPVTVPHFLTWRAQDSQTWTKYGVSVVLQAPLVPLALLVHQWQSVPMVQ